MKKVFCLFISLIFISFNSISLAYYQVFEEDGKYGIRNSETKNIVVNPQFEKIEKLGYKTYKTYKNEKYGLIKYTDNTAKILLNNEYDEIIYDYRKQLILKKNNKIGLYDFREEKLITKCIYDEMKRVNSKYHKLKINDKYAIFNEKNNTISQDLYEDVREGKLEAQYSQDNIQVKINGKWKYIKKGKLVKQFTQNGVGKIVAIPMLIVLSPIIVPLAIIFDK